MSNKRDYSIHTTQISSRNYCILSYAARTNVWLLVYIVIMLICRHMGTICEYDIYPYDVILICSYYSCLKTLDYFIIFFSSPHLTISYL